jgi:hypothetical protein
MKMVLYCSYMFGVIYATFSIIITAFMQLVSTYRFLNLFRCPDLFYPLTVGVEVVYFHLITLRHTPQAVGLLWTRYRPVAETST